jgi:hypothetical protein
VKDIAYAAGYVVILHDDTQVCFHFILTGKRERENSVLRQQQKHKEEAKQQSALLLQQQM